MEIGVKDYQELRSRMIELVKEIFRCDTSDTSGDLGPVSAVVQVSGSLIDGVNICLFTWGLNVSGIRFPSFRSMS